MATAVSFPPVAAADCSVLILGSMPGKASLQAAQYYAHPRNAFWPLMDALLGVGAGQPYAARCDGLVQAGVALWDVLQSCTRSGSLDADIVESSIVANDFNQFLDTHAGIGCIFFNGAMAERSLRRYVTPGLKEARAALPMVRLPSTSPAHAALDFSQKLDSWQQVAAALQR